MLTMQVSQEGTAQPPLETRLSLNPYKPFFFGKKPKRCLGGEEVLKAPGLATGERAETDGRLHLHG